MRRYRGIDKPPGPSVSPPPRHAKLSATRAVLNLHEPESGLPPRRSPSGSIRSPPRFQLPLPNGVEEANPFTIKGSGAGNAFLDPVTKKPILIPQPGRSVPKLKMSDLTRSFLPPMGESMGVSKKSMMSKTDKKVAAAIKEVTSVSSKDMLESFDDAVRVPDVKVINSKMALLRKGATVPELLMKPSMTKYSTAGLRVGRNRVGVDVSRQSQGSSRAEFPASLEEQNIRVLMDRLKEKYMEDMESQLGLAVQRRPKAVLGEDGATPDQSGGDGPLEFEIPRPSTSAHEIATRIDKVVRDWATESQKLKSFSEQPSKQGSSHRQLIQKKRTTQSLHHSSRSPGSPTTENVNRRESKARTSGGDAAPTKNKNLEKISAVLRKSLDPVSKQDVSELINIIEEDHAENVDDEHEEMKKAHASVFKNAVPRNDDSLSTVSSSEESEESFDSTDEEEAKAPPKKDTAKGDQPAPNPKSKSPKKEIETRKPFVEAMRSSKGDENEMFTILKEHMEYEAKSGPPKLSLPRKPSFTKVPQKPIYKGPSSSLLRSDVAGKAIARFNESQRKLLDLVDTFQEKDMDISAAFTDKEWKLLN